MKKKMLLSFMFFPLMFSLLALKAKAQIPGDANADSVVDIGDVVYEVNYLFKNGPSPVFYECGDPNADCLINVEDILCLVNYLFKLGANPQIVDCGWSEPVNLGAPINSSAADDAISFTPDFNKLVWNRTDRARMDIAIYGMLYGTVNPGGAI